MEGGGEDGHPGKAFVLELGPHGAGLGVGAGGVADDELDGDVAGGDGGEELAVEAEHGVRVGLAAHLGQGLAFEHRHRIVVAGDRDVEDGLGEAGFVGERLVDGLHSDAGGGGDGGHGGGGKAVGEEQVVGGVDDGRRVRRACS